MNPFGICEVCGSSQGGSTGLCEDCRKKALESLQWSSTLAAAFSMAKILGMPLQEAIEETENILKGVLL